MADINPIQQRIVEASVSIRQDALMPDDIGFLPSVLCHVYFPYKNPGDQDSWMRKQGNYVLSIDATKEYNPVTNQMERFGLPFGGKSRWLLAVLNSLALKGKSPEIYLGNCLTEFIGDTLKMDTNGRTIRDIKNHMGRLAAADLKMTYLESPVHTHRERLPILEGFDMWYSKDPGQKLLWSNYARFSDKYYNELTAHAVPMDLRAMWSMLHKPMALDLYAALSYRLHSLNDKLFVPWQAMKQQFGYAYAEMKTFKRDFRNTVDLVKLIYPDAKISEQKNAGFWLLPSRPPIAPKKHFIEAPKEYVFIETTPKKPAKAKKKDNQEKGPQSIGDALQDLFSTLSIDKK